MAQVGPVGDGEESGVNSGVLGGIIAGGLAVVYATAMIAYHCGWMARQCSHDRIEMTPKSVDRWLEQYFKQIHRTQDAYDEHQEFMIQVAAGEPMMMFGQPVEIEIRFTNGSIPLGKATIEEFQAEMRRWLAAHRERVTASKARRSAAE